MPKPLHINFSNVWIFIAKIANSERRSSLRSQCHRNEIFVNCKNDNLCVTKELFFVGDVNLITLVYEKKQKLMLTLLAMHKIAKKKVSLSFVRFITILLAGCGKVSLKFHPYSPTSEPLSLGWLAGSRAALLTRLIVDYAGYADLHCATFERDKAALLLSPAHHLTLLRIVRVTFMQNKKRQRRATEH